MQVLTEYVDISAIQSEIEGAEAINQAVAQKKEKAKQEGIAAKATDLAYDCTTHMEQNKSEIRKRIEDADMPIEGLGLRDGTVTMDGLPLEQASDSDILRISCAIAMRICNDLKVIRIRHGSLLDSKSLVLLSEIADEFDCQIWIERVDESGKIGFVIEDGRVVSRPGDS